MRVLVKLAIPEVRGVRPQAAGSSGWPHTTQCGSYPQARRCEVVKAYWRGARLTVDAVRWTWSEAACTHGDLSPGNVPCVGQRKCSKRVLAFPPRAPKRS